MLVLGIDIGGATRNAMTLMDSESRKIIEYSYIPFDSANKMEHRQKVLDEVKRYLDKYNVGIILFERIELYRGGHVSPLDNIISLCKIQTKFIDNLSDIVNMYDIRVQTWKADVLGNKSAKKEDSIKFVEKYYPEVDLKIIEHHKRKGDVEIINHDLADSVCIALYGCKNFDKLDHLMNYR